MGKPYTFIDYPTTAPDKSIGIAQPLNKYKTAWMFASVDVLRETEKAVQIGHPDTKITVWIPKAALQHDTRGENFDPTVNYNYIVAPWFISSPYRWK